MSTSAPTDSCSATAPPTAKATGSITPTRNNAATARCGTSAPRAANAIKVVTRHVWEASRERMDQHRLSRVGKRIYKRRKETVERSFADAKQLHGHRYARMRGLTRVQQQCLLAATAQNIKKIALLLSRMGPHMPLSTLPAASKRLYRPCCAPISKSTKPRNNRLKIQHPKTNPTKNDGVRQQSERPARRLAVLVLGESWDAYIR